MTDPVTAAALKAAEALAPDLVKAVAQRTGRRILGTPAERGMRGVYERAIAGLLAEVGGADGHALLSGKRGATRLGFAVTLRFFAREGRFPDLDKELDADAVAHVARQVQVPVREYAAYDLVGRTREYHRAQIREAFGFRTATVEDAEALADWLSEEVAPREYDLERRKEAAYARLKATKVEPPTPGRVAVPSRRKKRDGTRTTFARATRSFRTCRPRAEPRGPPTSTSGCEREATRSASPAFRASCHARTVSGPGTVTRGRVSGRVSLPPAFGRCSPCPR